MSFDIIERKFRTTTPRLVCARCGGTEGVELQDSRTQYHFDGPADSPDNPNRPIPLCRPCAEDHHTHWNEMWAEYRAGLL